jgi:Beta-lactamase enzyme family
VVGARTVRAAAAAAGAVVIVVAVSLGFRGPGGNAAGGGHLAAPPSGRAASPASGTRQATSPLAAPSSAVPSSAAPSSRATTHRAIASHADPFSGPVPEYLARRSGTILAAVYDVRTGQSWRLDDGQAQAEASVVKLDILETILADSDGSGLPATDQALARQMIDDSDNAAATSLWGVAGGAAGLAAYNAKAGLTRTILSPCVACAGFPWPGWGLSTTVPYDQITLLKQLIEPGPLLTNAERGYALSLLESVVPNQAWGISGGVPAGVLVALKNGWLPLNDAGTDWQINSQGWVSGDGRDYLIAVLTTGNPTEQYGIDTINGLSSLIWAAMH